MSFLTQEDYKVLITPEDLEIVDQSDSDARELAETMAQDQMIGYLNQRFDTVAIFTASEDYRSREIIMRMIDIALYHMHSQLPGRMGLENRRLRYEDALKWLSDVAKGNITPILPPPAEDATDPLPCNWGSSTRQKYDW